MIDREDVAVNPPLYEHDKLNLYGLLYIARKDPLEVFFFTSMLKFISIDTVRYC